MSGPSINCIILSTTYDTVYSFILHPNGMGVDDFFAPYDYNGPTNTLTNCECIDDDPNHNGATDYNLLVGPSSQLQDYFQIEGLPTNVDIVNDTFKILTVVSVAEFVDVNDRGMPTNIDYRNILYLGVQGQPWTWGVRESNKLSIGYFNPTTIPPYDIELPVGMNGWKGVSYTWTINPATGLPWEWGDIVGMNIGYASSVPTQYTYMYDDPNGQFFNAGVLVSDLNGDVQTLDPSTPSAGNNWWCIMNNGDGRYVYVDANNAFRSDLYKFDGSHGYWGYPWDTDDVITNVAVVIYVAMDTTGDNVAHRYCKTMLKTNGFTYPGNQEIYGLGAGNYVAFETSYPNNPQTGVAWTAAELDAAQFGVGLFQSDKTKYFARCDSVFLKVDYIHPDSGKVAVTQCYASITATHPNTSSCRLPFPSDMEINQEIDTMGLNFNSGNREVYGLGRSSKRTILSGLMWDGCTNGIDTCEDIISCIRALGKLQKPIILTGLDQDIADYSSLCTDYNILSFSWTQVSEQNNSYEWSLELEFCK